MNDRFDLPLSTHTEAAEAYIGAVDNLLRADAKLVERFDDVLKLDPDFALAEIARARCLAIYGEGAGARASASRAQSLARHTSRREQQHVNALALAVEGRANEALRAIREHLEEFPRDALVLQPAVSAFGFIGFSGRLDRVEELLTLLEGLAPHYGDDWWFESIHAYAEVDAGRLLEAETRVQRSLEREPRNANAVHVRTHVYYELEQHPQCAQFLDRWLGTYTDKVLLRGHLAWHLALLDLALGNPAAAWARYQADVALPLHHPEQAPTSPLNILTDAAAFLWRAELKGEPRQDDDWRLLSEFASRRFPNAGIPYGDFHSLIVHARSGSTAAASKLRQQLFDLAKDRPACATASAVGAGLTAYAHEDWSAAVAHLLEGHAELVRLGGSKAQLDLVSLTLMHAYRRQGREAEAQALAKERPHLRSAA